jgi:hypothetical protein
VRYHLSDIPQVDAAAWSLGVGGDAANGEVRLGLDELKRLPAAEVVAVCQCSGNRRGLFVPHVPGVEWGYGAMGCARWKGARLKDVLDRAGLTTDALEIVLAGADMGATDKTPQFIKSLPVWKALEETTLVAYEMNGAPLPTMIRLPMSPARVRSFSSPPHRQRSGGAPGYVGRRGKFIDSPHPDFSDGRVPRQSGVRFETDSPASPSSCRASSILGSRSRPRVFL